MPIKLCIGIPAYDGVCGQVLEDYMRLAYRLGRNTNFQLFSCVKEKQEQFRARNFIAKNAIQAECDYLLFLDDDHIIGTKPENYNFVEQHVEYMEKHPEVGILGCLYYKRAEITEPVVMVDAVYGGHRCLFDDEIKGEIQEVAVQGGGVMLVRVSAFAAIGTPWFDVEHKEGTDVQLSRKMREAGYKVMCDTSFTIGHFRHEKSLVTGNPDKGKNWIRSYKEDILEYLDCGVRGMQVLASEYNDNVKKDFGGDLVEYYRNAGKSQIARNAFYHLQDNIIDISSSYVSALRTKEYLRLLDYGCGTAPIGFALRHHGHEVFFVDISGCESFKFLQWRIRKHNLEEGVKFFSHTSGWYSYEYDGVLLMDVIEHMPPEAVIELLNNVSCCTKSGGLLITNFFQNNDYENVEHICMDKSFVENGLRSVGFTTINKELWIRR